MDSKFSAIGATLASLFLPSPYSLEENSWNNSFDTALKNISPNSWLCLVDPRQHLSHHTVAHSLCPPQQLKGDNQAKLRKCVRQDKDNLIGEGKRKRNKKKNNPKVMQRELLPQVASRQPVSEQWLPPKAAFPLVFIVEYDFIWHGNIPLVDLGQLSQLCPFQFLAHP